ncbi:late competence protein ComER [Robertmurraya kyonggiensis]|uniref:Late competence protein ComER n=1 Tax=Robertmurraya kyonggiensis TaxID=1037680 RepID=A0A4U1DDA9_9BACI|nr:late competence protein ComER [Robertmurraya kyonggiensis]TKC19983.1 late competence protein ComER [Robertmurraya kyonggiensis]
MKIGFIGTGNMGRILIEALLDGKAVSPSSLYITNRTISKALDIRQAFPEIVVCNKAEEVAKQAELLFVCVKPIDMFDCIQNITPLLTNEHCVVSITSPISIEQLESVVPCSSARVIPSITNRALAGVSLLSFGEKCTPHWKEALISLVQSFSTPLQIEENITRVASDIVSCGPAFFSYLTRRFIDAAVSETSIDEETATKLASEMLIGLGELLRKEFYTLPTLQEKVCVKGGITGEGIKVLEEEIGAVFEHVFQATHSKFAEDIKETKKQFTLN